MAKKKKSKQARIDFLTNKIVLYEQAKGHIEKLGKSGGDITINSTLGKLSEWIAPRLDEMKTELFTLT